MNPTELELLNVGRFDHLPLKIPSGCIALTGPNGSGKSTLLDAIELALFAEGSRDLAPCLSPWADRLAITLTFEHGSTTYRIRRGYKQGSGGKGTATLDFERQNDSGEWDPLSRESTAATQDLIEATLGLSRRTFRASSFLKQGDSGAFPEASPAERKSVIAEACDPTGLWPRLAELARADVKQAETAIAADLLRISEREEIVSHQISIEDSHQAAKLHELGVTEAHDKAVTLLDETLAAVQANAASVERHKAAVIAHRTAEMERARAVTELETAQAFAAKLEPAVVTLRYLDERAAKVPGLEKLVDEQTWARSQYELAQAQRSAGEAAITRQKTVIGGLEESLTSARSHFDAVALRIRHLEAAEDGGERCDRCDQLLGIEARAAALKSLRAESVELKAEVAEIIEAINLAGGELTELEANVEAIPLPEIPEGDFTAELAAARQAAEQRGTVATLIESYEEHRLSIDPLTANLSAAAAVLLQRTDELAQAAEGMTDAGTLDQAVAEARNTVATRRRVLDEAKAAVVRVEEQLARVRTASGELENLRANIRFEQQNLDLLKLAERAYGRDGIPVLLVESVIPQIEAEANRILEQMPTSDGVVFTLELRTQRALKSDADKVRETLDILVSDPDSERAFETFSGGERARLNIALRIALARLLAHRRGAESRLLAIDELEYLDTQGQEHLVDVIKGVAADFDRCVVVSHSPNVRDAFDQVIEIEKQDGVSRIASDRVEVAA